MGSLQLSKKENPRRSFWNDTGRWPKGDREHIFLAAAFNEVGAAMFGAAWTGDEALARFDYSASDLRLISIPQQKPLLEAWKVALPGREAMTQEKLDTMWEAHERGRLAKVQKQQALAEPAERADKVVDWLSEQTRNGDVKTVGRLVTGGPFFSVVKSLWNIEQPWARLIEGCTFSSSGNGESYLFLSREDLARCIAAAPFNIAEKLVDAAPPEEVADLWWSPFMKVVFAAAREAKLTDDIEAAPSKSYLEEVLRNKAAELGVEGMSENMIGVAATLLRHPESKLGKARKR